MVQRVALYTRVSTSDQSCERQVAELTGFAERSSFEIVAVVKGVVSEFGKNRTLTRYAATILDELTHNVLENTIGLAQVQAPHHRQ